MCDLVASKSEQTYFSETIRQGRKPLCPPRLLEKAKKARESMSSWRSTSTPANTAKQPEMHAASAPIKETALSRSSFAVIGASIRDNRQRIIALADEQSLHRDQEACQKARAELTNPRTRLSAELGWLPGVSPRRASQLLEELQVDPGALWSQQGIPALAKANLIAAALELIDAKTPQEKLTDYVVEFAQHVETVRGDDVMREINEDRLISEFPAVQNPDQIEAILAERKRDYFPNTIRDALLQRLEPQVLVSTMSATVDKATHGGKEPGPGLIHDLVDKYEVEVHGVLDVEGNTVDKLASAVLNQTVGSGPSVESTMADLERVVRNWGQLAKPIQISFKARGIDHRPSLAIAATIRNLALELFNKHDRLVAAQRLTSLMSGVFAAIPGFLEKVEKDSTDLKDIAQSRDESARIEPLRKLCTTALKDARMNPQLGFNEAEKLYTDGLAMLETFGLSKTSAARQDGRDQIAATMTQCAIEYGNVTSRWANCETVLQKALPLTTDAKLAEHIRSNLATVKGNKEHLGDLEPIASAPSLSTINGIGFTLYGSSDKRASDNSYMSTYYFVFLALPIFPIARYRVIPTERGYRFLGKGKLRTFDKWHIAISLALIGLMFLSAK